MIVIMETIIDTDLDTGQPISRGVTIWISDGGATAYIHQIGNLPLVGNLQTILNAYEAAIWIDAVAAGRVATPAETAKAERIQWFTDNPGATVIYTATKADLEAGINALVDAIVPSATGANRTKLKRLLMAGALFDREQVVG